MYLYTIWQPWPKNNCKIKKKSFFGIPYCRIISRRQASLQLLPENIYFFTFLFSFCFFFFSLTISRSSMVSSKESPDFVACGGNGSFTTTWQRNVKLNTTAFGNSFTALLISVIFGNFMLLCAVYGKFLQHLQFLQRSVVSGFMTWKLFRWKAREIGFDLIKSAISADSV